MKTVQLSKIIFTLITGVFLQATPYANDDPWSTSYQLETQGKYIEAANNILPLVNNSIKSEYATLRVAWLYYLAQNYEESTRFYTTALTLNPNSLDARLGLMLPLMAQSRWREASLYGEQVLTVAPWQYYAHIRLMACEAAQLLWEKLEKHAATVSERYPSTADPLVFLARAQSKLSKTAEAKASYSRVLQMYPENIEALKYIVSH